MCTEQIQKCVADGSRKIRFWWGNAKRDSGSHLFTTAGD